MGRVERTEDLPQFLAFPVLSPYIPDMIRGTAYRLLSLRLTGPAL